jgi:membrane-bound lytic murein transglycosylase D
MGFIAASSPQAADKKPVSKLARSEHASAANEQAPTIGADNADGEANRKTYEPDDLWERIRRDLSWQHNESAKIDKARNNYLRQSNYLPMVAERADYYLYYIVEEVQKRNMPVEIALIPILESSMDPFASASNGAAGLWQIMPETGIRLGLEQDSSYDGRHALTDSTTVALDYLEALHAKFDNDWFLALAAYNSGAGTVERARAANAAQGLGTDYWSLKLSHHTTSYVPKLIALAQIVAEPERFDVHIPSVDNAPSFEVVDAEGPLQMSQAAELAGVDVDTLRALNPGQLRDSISYGGSLEILVPFGTGNRFEHNIAKLSPEELVQWKTYRIKPGDSLSQIARMFDTDVAVLQEVNSMRGSNIQAGDTLKIPGEGGVDNAASAAPAETPAAQGYMVRKGDSLYGIAGKFKVSVKDIVSWNGLDPAAYLKPGQKLKLYPKGG